MPMMYCIFKMHATFLYSDVKTFQQNLTSTISLLDVGSCYNPFGIICKIGIPSYTTFF